MMLGNLNDIPIWATHLFTFKVNNGYIELVLAVKEGRYQYLINTEGNREKEQVYDWGVEDWKLALEDIDAKYRIEEINVSLENE